jgi:methylenetetrahydrofolate dehydrogenase (NADP+)/methenyltetrahydrofolate cyclohydrolase
MYKKMRSFGQGGGILDNVLNCKEVNSYLIKKLTKRCSNLEEEGITPTAAFVRIGSKRDDIAYQNSIMRTCNTVGVSAVLHELEDDATMDDLTKLIKKLNHDDSIHGIMIFRPLPEGLDEAEVNSIINPDKDIEGMNPVNLAKVFAGNYSGFAPCTAAAVMEILKYYKIDLEGKHAVILGRSMVVGKPLSMMMLKENETVTLCHSKSENIEEVARMGDLLVAAIGKPKAIGADYVKPGAIVIDVGINVDKDGNIVGDVDFEAAAQKASLITPVPGGVGSVTTAILIKNIIKAAQRLQL